METGVSYNKQRLHKVGYFRELLSTNEDVHESIRPLLKLSRDTVVRLSNTRMRPPQSGFVQVGFATVIARGRCYRRYARDGRLSAPIRQTNR